ncbi:Hypothetical predicted protein [Lecanosticta acicola]|uniref:Uncharacterized protein n=1 Tax=Lecanosticta acicola TaxID=111012 RepID=A0AAI9EFS1_9PEZI|nr:Hypothetical predicted protein [Lecanosticta acicola]
MRTANGSSTTALSTASTRKRKALDRTAKVSIANATPNVRTRSRKSESEDPLHLSQTPPRRLVKKTATSRYNTQTTHPGSVCQLAGSSQSNVTVACSGEPDELEAPTQTPVSKRRRVEHHISKSCFSPDAQPVSPFHEKLHPGANMPWPSTERHTPLHAEIGLLSSPTTAVLSSFHEAGWVRVKDDTSADTGADDTAEKRLEEEQQALDGDYRPIGSTKASGTGGRGDTSATANATRCVPKPYDAHLEARVWWTAPVSPFGEDAE